MTLTVTALLLTFSAINVARRSYTDAMGWIGVACILLVFV